MVNEELERARAELRKTGANWALLALPENVTYTSHWEVPVQFGPMTHLSYAPPLALVGVTEQACLLLVHNYYAEAARTATTFNEVLSYDLVPLFPPYQLHGTPRDNFIAMLRVAVERAGLNRPGLTLAIEDNVLPALALHS